MADRTLTINHADGGSETYTINRDKFAGVREMSRGHVYPMVWGSISQNNLDFEVIDDSTFNLTAADNTSTDWLTFLSYHNPIRTGKHRLEFDLTLNSGAIDVGFVWNYTDTDEDPNDGNSSYSSSKRPVVGHNSWDFEIFNDGVSPYPHVFFQINAGSTFDISVTNFKITHEPSTVTADHTATPKAQSKETTFGGSKSITVNRDIEPLLSKVVGGAAAAYSLRDLNDSQGNNNVVRVRRESDNSEKDFLAKELSNGTLTRWVNEQPTLPLDLRELDTNTGERDGALIEAAAAYSLRKLKEDFTGDVVEVRRNVDGETEGFTAAEVTDGTMEGFVNASFDDELPLDQATGAAAAYSLRNLSSSYTGNVVEVRRSSDDAVKSFTASEVADGTLEDWVNEDLDITNRLIVPSDIATRFVVTSSTDASNYNASIDNDSASTDFVEMRSGLFREGRYRLTGTLEVSNLVGNLLIQTNGGVASGTQNVGLSNGTNNLDFEFDITGDGSSTSAGSTLLYFLIPSGTSATLGLSNLTWEVTQADGHVKTWYDQSGSDNHAVQTDTAKQPKIVDAGVLVTGGIDFDGSDDELASEASVDIAQLATAFSVVKPEDVGANKYIWTIGGTSGIISFLNSSEEAALAAGSPLVDGTLSTVDDNLKFDFCNTTSSIVAINGSSGTSGTIGTRSGNDVIRIGGRGGADLMSGTIREIIIYNSDQSDKRRAIEENIANHYDISLAAFSRDGTVKTWYDQSGSTPANDATQTDPTKQPKIVVNGSLVQKRNKPSIKFADDSSDERYLTSPVDIGSSFSFFASWQPLADDVTAGSGAAQKRNSTLLYGSGSLYIAGINSDFTNGYKSGAGADSYSAGIDFQKSLNLHTIIEGSADINYFGNGTNEIDGSGDASTVTATKYYIGSKVVVPTHNTRGYISELIHYNSDQSDNRTAIEANIGETYGITEIPAADDTVNGFVQTWYDQSGSGNDAEQTTASRQPKIVDGGTLIKRNNNPAVESTSDNYLGFTLDSLSADGQQSVFAVLENDVTSQDGFSAVFKAMSDTGSVTNRRPYWFVNLTGSLVFSVDSASGYENSDRNRRLYSHIMNDDNGGTSTIHRDGTQVDTRAITLDANSTFLDGKISGLTPNATGSLYMSEVIYYTDDQSSNRPAIEANIANQYGITIS